jgi:predicted Zn-dependent peptidase
VGLAFEGPKSTALLNVVKQCLTLSGASAFAAPGLVGVYAGVPVASASTVAESLSAAVTAIPSNDVVERAKAMAKAEAVFALDGGSQSLAGAMTSSVLETGSFGGAAQIAASYDAITPKDVAAAYTAMLKSTPSMAAVGDIAAVPYHATVASRFS